MTPKTEAGKWNSGTLHFIIYTCAFPAVTWQNVSEGKRVKKKEESLFAHVPYKAHHSGTGPLLLTHPEGAVARRPTPDVNQCHGRVAPTGELT